MILTAEIIPNFSLGEARCPHCGLVILDPDLTAALSEVRRIYDKPIRATSWTRCVAHNTAKGGKANSYHLNGRAVDLKAINDGHMIHLREVCESVFAFTKDYPSHVHCDVRGERPRGQPL